MPKAFTNTFSIYIKKFPEVSILLWWQESKMTNMSMIERFIYLFIHSLRHIFLSAFHLCIYYIDGMLLFYLFSKQSASFIDVAT